jgi:hypothetical protein
MKSRKHLKYKLIVACYCLSLMAISGCISKKTKGMENIKIENSTHKTWVSLTVSESKRLIAKGIKVYPPVLERLNNGTVLVTKGTTNTYVAEELLNINLGSGDFVLGHILPNKEQKLDRSNTRSELVLINGEEDATPYVLAMSRMKEGDIVFKGANVINYEKGQAGVLIGHPTGGTTGNIIPQIEKNKLHLIIPVGLEKCSNQDIDKLNELTQREKVSINGNMPYIWSIKGELFTEIEAIKQFADVEVLHMASGGIGGAEGAVSLGIFGSEKEVKKALKII